MAVRKRTWISGGKSHTAWVVDYKDGQGKRRLKTFATKKEADAWAPQTAVDVRAGIHTADSASITVEQAAKLWIEHVETEGREAATVRQYRQHAALHINPRIGSVKLSRLTTPAVKAFRDELLRDLSRPLARKVLTSLKSLISAAMLAGKVAHNPALPVKIGDVKRHKARVVPPTLAEVQHMIAHAGAHRAIIVVAAMTGLRASELRGLRWSDVDLAGRTISVGQRADRWGKMGSPKSEESRRVVPVGAEVVRTLKEWKLACPKGDAGLVFPNGAGNVENLGNMRQRILDPIQITAGVCDPVLKDGKPVKDAEGKPVMRARYGWHAFRHFYASWLISQGYSAKTVQARLGHATIQLTLDTYAHLWPSDDRDQIDAAERALLG